MAVVLKYPIKTTQMWLIYSLTNRFHVAVYLFSNRSQMTSKCGKKKKMAHKPIVECVSDVLTTFWHPLWSITEQMHSNMESYLKACSCPLWRTWKKPFDVICCLYKIKQSHWLLCIARKFLSSEQPCELKSLDVAFNIARVFFHKTFLSLIFAQSPKILS